MAHSADGSEIYGVKGFTIKDEMKHREPPANLDSKVEEEEKTRGGDGDLSSVASSDSNPEDQIRCRICHSSTGVLYRPCACSGSIANVHQDCLLQWLTVKNMRDCEVCHTTYVFTPIYATDAPVYASAFDVAHWLVEKALTLYPRLLRCLLVLASWLVFVPLLTAWIWQLCFVSSLTDLIGIANVNQEQLWRSLQTGAVICFVVLLVTVMVATFRELMREEHHLAAGQGGGAENGLFPGDEDLFDGDDPALDEVVDDVPFSTWVGFTGPLKFFFIHITSVVLYNTVFLALAVFLPLQAGRIFFSAAHIDVNVFSKWVFDRVGDALQAGIIGEAYTPSPERYEAMYEGLPLKDASLLFCGYLSLIALATVWGPLSAALNLNDLAFVGFICGLLRYILTGFKFGALVGFELGVFPVYLGWCLDLLVLDLVDSTWEARKRFFNDAPLTSVAMHWFLGINFILYVSFVASLLRRIIKKRILSRFLRYPDDPDFQPFHDFIYVPLYQHCKRLCISGILYTLLVVLCVHIPAKIFTRLFPTVAPLRWQMVERGEVPVDLLLLHFAIPAIMGHIDLRSVCLEAVKSWFISVSTVLGIDIYLLKEDLLRELGQLSVEGMPENDPGENNVHAANGERGRENAKQPVDEAARESSDKKEEQDDGTCGGDASHEYDREDAEWHHEPENKIDDDILEDRAFLSVHQGTKDHQNRFSGLEKQKEASVGDDHKHSDPDAGTEVPSTELGAKAAPGVDAKARYFRASCTVNTSSNPETKSEIIAEPVGNAAPRELAAASIPHFTLKVFLLVLSSWMMHTIILCACILIPVVLGRVLLRTINAAAARHDIYAVVVGLYAYLGGVIAGGRINAFLRRHDILDGLALAVKWIFVALRYIFLSFFVLGVLPMLLGILFDLTVLIPLRVPHDESPRIPLERDWVLGVIFLKVWFQLLVSGIVGDNDVKDAVQRIFNQGPENVSVYDTMKRAILPYLHRLLLHLAYPCAFSRCVVPFLLYGSRLTVLSLADAEMNNLAVPISNSVMALHPSLDLLTSDSTALNIEIQCVSEYCFRYAFLALVLVKLSGTLANLAANWYANLKQSMYEERYLIGKRLHNFREPVTADGPGASTVKSNVAERKLDSKEAGRIDAKEETNRTSDGVNVEGEGDPANALSAS